MHSVSTYDWLQVREVPPLGRHGERLLLTPALKKVEREESLIEPELKQHRG